MISNDILKMIEDDFSKFESKKSLHRFEEDLNQLRPLLIEVRSRGIPLSQISNILKLRGIKIPNQVLKNFIQEKIGEKKKIKSQRKVKINTSNSSQKENQIL